jgi:hypothetical protein
MSKASEHRALPFREVQNALASQRLTLCNVYGMARGARRRAKLIEWLSTAGELGLPRGIPVNCRWQANTVDPDLQYLMKGGVLVRERSHGGRRHPKNRSSGKRQTYLVLAN